MRRGINGMRPRRNLRRRNEKGRLSDGDCTGRMHDRTYRTVTLRIGRLLYRMRMKGLYEE